MKNIFCLLLILNFAGLRAQNELNIPPILSGTNFDLTVQSGTKIFYGNSPTPTYGINGGWMSPTILVNSGDSITLNVLNNLNVETTMHWHGLHVAAKNDGGPHQIIEPGSTWSPSFKVRNKAGTFWYHPHGNGKTDVQVAKGLVGMFIVKDEQESELTIPRTYGIDDFPLMVQSKAFDDLQQIAIATEMDTALFINGTLNPYLNAPAQVVRFRIVNASSMRSYNFGLSNGQNFYQIAVDGGLLDSSISINRLRLSPGERAEILINFSGLLGEIIYLKSYASEMSNGIYGAETVGQDEDIIPEYDYNFLNGADFNLLKINVIATTENAITTIPNSLVTLSQYEPSTATVNRTIVLDTIRLLSFDTPNLAEGPFGIDNLTFNMETINQTINLNTTEIWTVVNRTMVAHPFHIHDVQFNVVENSGLPPISSERGWKDVVLVMPNDSVKFITKFNDFADNTIPYMYHCHLLHHEDDGMMGSFLVVDSTATSIDEIQENSFVIYPIPLTDFLTIDFKNTIKAAEIKIFSILGEIILEQKIGMINKLNYNLSSLNSGIYFIQLKQENKIITRKIIKQ